MFKLNPKIKINFTNKKKTVNVYIDKVTIDLKLIIQILEVFKQKNLIIITDALEEGNALFKVFDQKNIKYATTFPTEKNPYLETILTISSNNTIKEILEKIIDCNPENILIYDKNDDIAWEKYLYNNKSLQNGKFLESGLTNLFLGFVFPENQVYIFYNTSEYDPSLINKDLKKIIFQ